MPIQDVDTRWNATYLMIERQICIRDIVEIMINSYENTLKDLYPTNEEWSKIMVHIFNFYYNF